MVMILDLLRVHFFHFQILIVAKISLLLELIWAHQFILITKKDILIIDQSPTEGLDDTTLTGEAQYSINFSRSNREFCLSVHYKYKGSNRFLFVNTTKIYQFRAKDSEIKRYPLCLGEISGDFSSNNFRKQLSLSGRLYDFSVDYKAFETSNIVAIHKYYIYILYILYINTKKHNIK